MSLSKIFLYALCAIGVLLVLFSLMADEHSYIDTNQDDYLLYFIYVVLAIATIGVLLSGVIGMINNPGGSKKSLIMVGAIVVAIVISFIFSSDAVLPTYGKISASTSKWSGVGLYTFYTLFVMAVGSIIYSTVSKLIK